MYHSQQVSGMISGQNQQFGMMGQPQMMGQSAFPTPGMSAYPPQFSHGPAANTPAFGRSSQAASMGMSAMGAVPGAMGMGIMGAGMAGMAGSMGMGMGLIGGGGMGAAGVGAMNMIGNLDPFSQMIMGGMRGVGAGGGRMMAGAGMRAAAGGMMGGLAGGAAMAAPLMLGGMAATAGIGAMVGGGQQQMGLNAQLAGQMQFGGGMGHRGRGFGEQQTAQIGRAMRSFEAADPFTTMKDMNQLMGQFTDMGMSQATRDADEFSDKFTKMAESVRKIAHRMGTTMQEAGKVFGEMRQAGFYNAADVTSQSTSMMVMKGMGMSQGQFMGLQQAGAGMTRANQMSGRSGALATTRGARDVMLGVQSGMFNEESIMDITGASDLAGGAAQLGQQRTAGMMRFMQSSAGRAMLGAVGEKEGGRFTGGINQEALSKIAGGGVGMGAMGGMARQNMGGSRGRASFVANEKDIMQSALGNEDTMVAMFKSMEESAKQRFPGGDDEDIQQILAQRFFEGDRRVADMMKKMADNHQKMKVQRTRRLKEELRTEAQSLDMERRFTVGGRMQQARGLVHGAIGAPLQQAGADIATGITGAARDIGDDFMGISRVNLSEGAGQQALMRRGELTGRAGGAFSGLAGIEASNRRAFFNRGDTREFDSPLFSGPGATKRSTSENRDIIAASRRGEDVRDMLVTDKGTRERLEQISGELRKDPKFMDRAARIRALRQQGGMEAGVAANVESLIQAGTIAFSGIGEGSGGVGIADRLAFVAEETGNRDIVRTLVGKTGGDNAMSRMFLEEQDIKQLARSGAGGKFSEAQLKRDVAFAAFNPRKAVGKLLTGRLGYNSPLEKYSKGGPGLNVLSALKGREGKFKAVQEKVLKELEDKGIAPDSPEADKALADALGKELNRDDIKASDVRALLKDNDMFQAFTGNDTEAAKEIAEAAFQMEGGLALGRMMGVGAETMRGDLGLQRMKKMGLGEEVQRLQTALGKGAGEGGEGADEAVAAMRDLVTQAEKTGGALGTGHVATEVTRVKNIRAQIRKRQGSFDSLEQLAKETGLSEELLRGARGDKAGPISAADAEKLALEVGAQEGIGGLGAGGQGAITGQSVELSLAQQIQTNTETQSKMVENVDKLHKQIGVTANPVGTLVSWMTNSGSKEEE